MLTTQEQILIEQRVANDKKSTGAAFLLWFFTGAAGGHRFYLGRPLSGAIMLILFIFGLLTALAAVGFLILIPLAVWALMDAFLIPGMIRQHADRLRRRLTAEAEMGALPAQSASIG